MPRAVPGSAGSCAGLRGRHVRCWQPPFYVMAASLVVLGGEAGLSAAKQPQLCHAFLLPNMSSAFSRNTRAMAENTLLRQSDGSEHLELLASAPRSVVGGPIPWAMLAAALCQRVAQLISAVSDVQLADVTNHQHRGVRAVPLFCSCSGCTALVCCWPLGVPQAFLG